MPKPSWDPRPSVWQKCYIKFVGISGGIAETRWTGRHEARQGGEGLGAQTHLRPASGQLWAPPGTDLIEDVEVPLVGGLTGHSSLL